MKKLIILLVMFTVGACFAAEPKSALIKDVEVGNSMVEGTTRANLLKIVVELDGYSYTAQQRVRFAKVHAERWTVGERVAAECKGEKLTLRSADGGKFEGQIMRKARLGQ